MPGCPETMQVAGESCTAVPMLVEGRMVRLPGGRFTMGERGDTVTVASVALDQTEVSVEAYAACVTRGACAAEHVGENGNGANAALNALCNYGKPGKENHPMNCVDWSEASAYCRAQGKRLPTEEEWEWAARGESEGRQYPWGNDEPGGRGCWARTIPGTCAVGSFASGDAPGPIHDLAGNVSEWTGSVFRGGAGGSGAAMVLRGGSWQWPDRAARRINYAPHFRDRYVGFRCAR